MKLLIEIRYGMVIFILFFIFLILGASLSNDYFNKNFVLFTAVVFLFMIGFRHISVGPDTSSYCNEFLKFSHYDRKELWFILRTSSEPLYVLLSWLAGQLSDSYSVYLLAFAIFIAYPIYKIQSEEQLSPKDILISYLVIFVLSFWAFFSAGIRQTAAIGFVLLSYKYLKAPVNHNLLRDANTYKFYALITMGYFFHNSIIVFALIYPFKRILQNFTVKGWVLLLVIVLSVVASNITGNQLHNLTALFFEERFNQYGDTLESSLNWSAYIMQFILFLLCYSVKDILQAKDKSNTLLMNITIIALVFQAMCGAVAEMFRISFYFSIFYIILFPRALYELKLKKLGSIAYLGFVVLSLLYLFFISEASMPQYKFFWQQ